MGFRIMLGQVPPNTSVSHGFIGRSQQELNVSYWFTPGQQWRWVRGLGSDCSQPEGSQFLVGQPPLMGSQMRKQSSTFLCQLF